MRMGQLLSAVDAGEPVAVSLLVRVDVVHSFCVPAVTTGFENGDVQLDFDVVIFRQICDLKGPHTRAVLWRAVLGKAKEAITKLQNASGGTRAALIVLNQRALRMLGPWASQVIGEIESQHVVLVWSGTCKQPPAIIEAND